MDSVQRDCKTKVMMDADTLKKTIQYFYLEKLDWCGCGRPKDAMLEIAKFLEGRRKNEPFPDDPLSLCLAYELDRAGFTEHGTNIYYCWLTEYGELFLNAIREAEKQGMLETFMRQMIRERFANRRGVV